MIEIREKLEKSTKTLCYFVKAFEYIGFILIGYAFAMFKVNATFNETWLMIIAGISMFLMSLAIKEIGFSVIINNYKREVFNATSSDEKGYNKRKGEE